MVALVNSNANSDLYVAKVIEANLNTINKYNRSKLEYELHNNNLISFNNDNCYIVRVDLNEEQEFNVITSNEKEHELYISSYKYSYYYCLDKNSLLMSSIILVNNASKNMIEVGGDK